MPEKNCSACGRYVGGDPCNGNHAMIASCTLASGPLRQAAAAAAVKPDAVNLPQHYARFKIEPVRFICENGLNFFQGNAVKYICRAEHKNGDEDIRKAIRYLEMWLRKREDERRNAAAASPAPAVVPVSGWWVP